MKAYLSKTGLFLIGVGIIISFTACSPKKCIVKGRVLDAETNRPIAGAAIAIRWLENQPNQTPTGVQTLEAAQHLSDQDGTFRIPDYPGKKYIMGVYKKGYICWSSHAIFQNGKEKKVPQAEPLSIKGIEIRLQPFKEGYSRNKHAGFAVLVAGEVTDSSKGPFHRAIENEFLLWRNNMRKEFQKKLEDNTRQKPTKLE
jgi:hypothetical protein